MNLIEQLGGYEKTNKILEQVKARDHKYAQNFERPALEKALLEYRRQHNIFEVGDKVIEITDYPSNDVLTVKSLSDNLLVCESDDLSASYVLSNKSKPYSYVRHVTDAEIEADKRLEIT